VAERAKGAPPRGLELAPMALDPELIKQLRELKALVDEGLLTEDEFAAKKVQLLGLPAAPGAVVGMPIVGAVALAPPPAQTAPVARQAAGKVATGVKLLLSDCGSKGVMVTGETMRAKAQLKAMGGRWDSRLTAWMFTGGATVAQLRVDLEARGIAVGEDGGAEDTSPDERRAAELAAEKAAVSSSHPPGNAAQHVDAKARAGDADCLCPSVHPLPFIFIFLFRLWSSAPLQVPARR